MVSNEVLKAKKVKSLRDKRDAAAERLVKSLDSARKQYQFSIKVLDQKLAKLEKVSGDPLVWVRRSPGQAPVYHSSENPCGKVPPKGQRGHYEQMFLGEALAEDLDYCRFCGHGLKPQEGS